MDSGRRNCSFIEPPGEDKRNYPKKHKNERLYLLSPNGSVTEYWFPHPRNQI